MRFINSVRAKASSYRPVVLTKRGVTELFQYFTSFYRILFLLIRPGLAVTSPSDRLALV